VQASYTYDRLRPFRIGSQYYLTGRQKEQAIKQRPRIPTRNNIDLSNPYQVSYEFFKACAYLCRWDL